MLINDHSDWYKNPEFWQIYKPLMFDPDRLEDTVYEVERIIDLADLNPPADVLDVCCGWGRHGFEFSRRGFNVTGVDITKPYLQKGRKFAEENAIEFTFIESDVREYTEPGRFDFAMNYFTSFGYFEEPDDDLKFCRNICESLKKGGRFLIDTIGKETVALNFKESEWFKRDGYLIMLEYKISDGWTHIINRWRFTGDDPSAQNELHETVFSHRLYSAVEMANLLGNAGFSEIQFFGALDGRPYDHKAQRMLALAVK